MAKGLRSNNKKALRTVRRCAPGLRPTSGRPRRGCHAGLLSSCITRGSQRACVLVVLQQHPRQVGHVRCRQKIAENPEWLATAEAKRQEVLARLIDSDKPAVPV
jgi:hypothetical protein